MVGRVGLSQLYSRFCLLNNIVLFSSHTLLFPGHGLLFFSHVNCCKIDEYLILTSTELYREFTTPCNRPSVVNRQLR